MVRAESIFGQLLKIFPRAEFERLVHQHGAERYSKGFGCWDQFIAMLFCHLGQARSLREICGGLATASLKLRSAGLRQAPKHSTLAYANQQRPWQLYESVFYGLLGRCQSQGPKRSKFRFKNPLYSLDATVIDLCLEIFDWAKFRRAKGGIKVHVVLNHAGYLPTYAVLTEANVHEVKIARGLHFPAGSIVVCDRGYTDYKLFSDWTEAGVGFVTRLKDNADYRVLERREVNKEQGIICDQVIEFTGSVSQKKCPQPLRRVRFRDPETNKKLVFLTNQMHLAAATIAKIYKDRWQIELFFKMLKQHVRIKTFVGTTKNAVLIQIWTALIAILLLKYLRLRSQFGWSMSHLSAMLRMSLFTFRDLWAWLNEPYDTPPLIPEPDQLPLLAA